MLVWVASFQRSGNTLTFRTLRDVYGQNPFCSIHKERLFMKGWRWKGDGYEVPRELKGLPKDEKLEALRARPEIFFIKSHRVIDSSDPAPALYPVRDGRDVYVSRAHWIERKKMGHYDLPFDQRLAKLIGSGNWAEHVRAWRDALGADSARALRAARRRSRGDGEAGLRRDRGPAPGAERRADAVGGAPAGGPGDASPGSGRLVGGRDVTGARGALLGAARP